jgi:hypothetical protein
MYTSTTRIGVTLPQAKRSCGINGPTLTYSQGFNNVKRTPRCLKLQYKETSIRMQDIEWTDPPLAPPALGDIKCQHTIN